MEQYSEKNINDYAPVSIGKLGIRLRTEVFGRILNSDNTKNKVIRQKSLTIGMGSKSIDYSVLHEDKYYSVSPDYKTFKINDKINTYYWDMYFKVIADRLFYLYAKENTRNGRRIDIDSLLKHKLNLSNHQNRIGLYLTQIDKLINNRISEKSILLSLKDRIYYDLITLNLENEKWSNECLGNLSVIDTGNKDVKDSCEDGKYNFYIRSKNILKINVYSFDGEAILIGGDGKINELIHYYNGKFNYHQRVYKISNFKNINGLYLYYFIHKFIGKQLLKDSAKTTVDSVRLPTLKNFNIQFPNIKEQNKIAYTLSQMDNFRTTEQNPTKLGTFNKFVPLYLLFLHIIC